MFIVKIEEKVITFLIAEDKKRKTQERKREKEVITRNDSNCISFETTLVLPIL